MSFYIVSYFVDIEISFSFPSYRVLEGNVPIQPVLRLSRPVDCCSTISVWVYVEEINAKCKYNLLCVFAVIYIYICFFIYKGSIRNRFRLIVHHFYGVAYYYVILIMVNLQWVNMLKMRQLIIILNPTNKFCFLVEQLLLNLMFT